MARALAAIDVKDLARHEAGPFEVEDRVDDVGDLAQMANVARSAPCIRARSVTRKSSAVDIMLGSARCHN